MAFELAEQNQLSHPFDTTARQAGRDWAYAFLKRSGLSLRRPEPSSIGRAMGFNRTQVDLFYSLLRTELQDHQFTASTIFNMDEYGLSTVPNRFPKVVSARGKRGVNKIVSGERGQTITVVCCFSASGVYVPPAFVFPRKRMRPELLDAGPAGSIGFTSDSGYMNTDLFVDYLDHFAKNVRPSVNSPVLLVLDNHSSHVSVAAIEFARKHFIHMLSLPPHGSHKIQPLDVVFFGPLKAAYASECDTWQVSHPGRAITQYEVAGIFRPAYDRTATVEKAAHGFRATGIWPYNPNTFSDTDFLPSQVTEVSNPAPLITENGATPDLENDRVELSPEAMSAQRATEKTTGSLSVVDNPLQPTTTEIEAVPAVVSGLSEVEGERNSVCGFLVPDPLHTYTGVDTVSTTLVTDAPQEQCAVETELAATPTIEGCVITLPSQSVDVDSANTCSSNYCCHPEMIRPFPKCTTRRAGHGRPQKASLITGSPFKLQAVEKESRKRKPTTSKPTSAKKKKTTCRQPETKAQKEARISRKQERSSYTAKGNILKRAPVDRSLKLHPVSHTSTATDVSYTCPGCGELFVDPPTESWIQCSGKCEQWWHEACTAYETGAFVCDFC